MMSVTTPELSEEPFEPRERRAGRVLLGLAAIFVLAFAVLLVRGWRDHRPDPAKNPAPVAPGMPVSNALESTYGIRFTAVALTASDGMIELRYTVVDTGKAGAVHADATIPYVVKDDHTFNKPGLGGHGHAKETPGNGQAGYILLTNDADRVHAGDVVTLHMGDIKLDHVPVLG